MSMFAEGLIWEPCMVSLLQKAFLNKSLDMDKNELKVFEHLCQCGFITEENHRMALTEKGLKAFRALQLDQNKELFNGLDYKKSFFS